MYTGLGMCISFYAYFLSVCALCVHMCAYMHRAANIMNDDELRMYTDLLLPYVYEVSICVYMNVCMYVCTHEGPYLYEVCMCVLSVIFVLNTVFI